jgi:hypothetical protein
LLAILPDHFERHLERLLEDPEPEVVSQAIRAVGALRKSRFLPSILQRLHDPALAADAISVLGIFGDEVIPALREALLDANIPLEIRREIPRALRLIDTPAAERVLMEGLLAPDTSVRLQVINALNLLHQRHPEFDLDAQMIDIALVAEIIGQYRSYQILNTLSQTLERDDTMLLALREVMTQRMERIFRLMALQYPHYDVMSIYAGFQSDNRLIYDHALEFLDNVLKAQLRDLIMPLIDPEVTDAERLHLADHLVGITMDRPEEALLTLMDSEDPWLKSCAVYTAGLLGFHALEPEIDRCLTHDDPLLRETARQAKLRLARHHKT